MRVPRIYQNQPLIPFSRIILHDAGARHLLAVLRLEKGHKIILFNGDGFEYPAEIIYAKRNVVEVQIKESVEKNFESSLKIHLGQVITKGEKMDYLLQKATELGVTAITPLFSTRGDVRLKGDREDKKKEHWQKVITAACEQCGRNKIPELHAPRKLLEFIQERNEPSRFILDHRAQQSIKEFEVKESVTFIIGPEGGLTFEEKLYAERNGFEKVHLGPRILRSETAGVAAITILQCLAGDLAVNSPSPQSSQDSE